MITPKSYIPPGVLNSEQIKDLAQDGVLHNASLESIEPDSSSIDLHISNKGWELNGSLKQIDRKYDQERNGVESICEKYKNKEINLTPKGHLLEKAHVYVFLLKESLDFSKLPFLYGEATGKSSIGRIDVLTRLLADDLPSYDYIKPPYKGPLFIEVIPISFNVIVYPGDSLNQLRFHCGEKRPFDEMALVGWRLLFLYENNNLRFADSAQKESTLSINLEPTEWGGQKIVAFEAKDIKEPIDFAISKEDKQNRLDPEKYFKPIESGNLELSLEKGGFYIIRSFERFALPKNIAVTGFAYTEHLGEVRIHYAGFAHPWFGMNRKDNKVGTPLIFEVRPHNFNVILRHREDFAKIQFFRMSEEGFEPKEKGPYSEQELSLSASFFREP